MEDEIARGIVKGFFDIVGWLFLGWAIVSIGWLIIVALLDVKDWKKFWKGVLTFILGVVIVIAYFASKFVNAFK